MSNTNDISRYVTRVDDGLIRPMTVRELMSRLNELISIDKSIARMPVGLSTDAEGNMIGSVRPELTSCPVIFTNCKIFAPLLD